MSTGGSTLPKSPPIGAHDATATEKQQVVSADVADAEWTPVSYIPSGMFAGRYMSFWLQVAQQPVQGRRKTEKDRRPLAPSPIVRLWIREHVNLDSPQGTLIDPTDLEVSHLICAADLYDPSQSSPTPSVGDPTGKPPPRDLPSGSRRRSPSPSRLSPRAKPRTSQPRSPIDRAHSRLAAGSRGGSDARARVLVGKSGQAKAGLELEQSSEEDGTPAGKTVKDSSPASRGSTRNRGRSERGNTTRADNTGGGRTDSRRVQTGRNLYGNLHVAAVRVISMEGSMGLWFLFTDLSLRNEGSYSLKFRCYDMTAISREREPVRHLAECQSATFKVYSPRNFPGLPKPTELAEHFSRQGYKLNTRKNDRQAFSESGSPSSTSRPLLGNAETTPRTEPSSQWMGT